MEKDNIKNKGMSLDEFVPNDDTVVDSDQAYLEAWGGVLETFPERPKVPLLTDDEIRNNAVKIVRFLNFVHPFLDERDGWKPSVEIRPIFREDSKQRDFSINSINLWNTEDIAVDMVEHLLKKINGKGYCLYYSLYALNNKKEVERKNNKGQIVKKASKNIGNDNAEFTQVLMMDLDKISEEEYIRSVELLRSIGLYVTAISSGFGYQLLIRLNEKCFDKTVLKRFTETVIRKGFKADSAIVDAARVARLPNSFNTKATSGKFAKLGQIPFAKTLRISQDTYSVEDVFFKLEQLEDKVAPLPPKVVKAEVKQISLNDVEIPTSKTQNLKSAIETKTKTKKVKEKDAAVTVKDLAKDYSMLKWSNVMETVRLMLAGAEGGYRNKVLFFMLPYFHNTLKLSKKQMIEVVNVWASKCTPTYENAAEDVERYFENYAAKMTSKYGLYGDLEQIYGPIQKDIYKIENGVNIPNMALKKLGDIRDGAFRIYLLLKREQHLTGKCSFTLEDIKGVCDIEKTAFFKHMNDLTKHSLMTKQKSAKKDGEEYRYQFNYRFENASKRSGYTSLDALYIWALDKTLTDGELKLYIYLTYRIRSANGEFKISQAELADSCKKTQSGISKMTDQLHLKRFIRKNTWEDEFGIPHTDYTLLQ